MSQKPSIHATHPFASHEVCLRDDLVGLGYCLFTVRAHVRVVGDLGCWVAAEGIEPADLTEAALGRFLNKRRAAGLSHCSRAGLKAVLDHLHREGLIPAELPNGGGPIERAVDEYCRYMRLERRLAPVTIEVSGGTVKRFLEHLAASGVTDLHDLGPVEVNEFVLFEAKRLCVGSARAVLGSLRPFLRFLSATGVVERDLSGTVPGVAGHRLGTLPRFLDAETASALLDSCDRTRASGLRDFAIMTLMVRLGLRAIEVKSMQLGDIAWNSGDLLVRGKGGRNERMPLPNDVGEAVAGYLVSGRPTSTSRSVFLATNAPFEPMSRNAVVFVPRSASRRLGVPVIGGHRLRHTVGTALLREGSSLQEVGQVLRQSSEAVTAVYAKVDEATLRLVVRPWPETGI